MPDSLGNSRSLYETCEVWRMGAEGSLPLVVGQASCDVSRMAKRTKRKRLENLVRTAEISSFNVYLSAGIRDANGTHPEREGDAWLEFRGTLNEPVKGQSAVRFGVHRAKDDNFGTKRPAVVGYVFSVHPDVHVYVQFQPDLYDKTFAMAMAGHVTHAHVVMTPPRYGSADVPSISFSNEPIE